MWILPRLVMAPMVAVPGDRTLRSDPAIVPKGTLRRAMAAREGNALYERALLPHPADTLPHTIC